MVRVLFVAGLAIRIRPRNSRGIMIVLKPRWRISVVGSIVSRAGVACSGQVAWGPAGASARSRLAVDGSMVLVGSATNPRGPQGYAALWAGDRMRIVRVVERHAVPPTAFACALVFTQSSTLAAGGKTAEAA